MAQNGWTALLIACASGHYETVEILKEAGTDLNIQNNVRTSVSLS